MLHLEVKKLHKDSLLPQYQTEGSAGMDLHAYLENPNPTIDLNPYQRILIGTGISISIPTHYEGQIRSRSGLAKNYGVICLNSPGTIDSDYRGEVKVLLYNSSDEKFTITNQMRIAQLIIGSYEQVKWNCVAYLKDTKRLNKGFGSTSM